MTQTPRGAPRQQAKGAPTTCSEPTRPSYPTQPLRDQLGDWWADPATAYWVGLQDGVELARRQDEQDHRTAVRDIARFLEIAERRKRAAA